MRKGYLVGAIIFFVLSVACIGSTVFGMMRGDYGMDSQRFWAALAFHPATAIAGAFLLGLAVPERECSSEDQGAPK